jgi:hypothetical protein
LKTLRNIRNDKTVNTRPCRRGFADLFDLRLRASVACHSILKQHQHKAKSLELKQ